MWQKSHSAIIFKVSVIYLKLLDIHTYTYLLPQYSKQVIEKNINYIIYCDSLSCWPAVANIMLLISSENN